MRVSNPIVSPAAAVAWTLAALIEVACAVPAEALEIQVLGLFRNQAVVLVDGKQRRLRTGSVSPEGVRLVEADSDSALLEVNGQRARYRLGTHIATEFRGPDRPAVRVWPDRSGMYRVGGSINGFAVEFVVDTGATLVAMNRRVARRIGIDFRVRGEPATSFTAAGPTSVFLVSLPRVRIGELELRDVRAAVHDGDYPQEVLLGLSFLGHLDLRRAGEALELRARGASAQPARGRQ